jgi:AraC-like DNA-binding protein
VSEQLAASALRVAEENGTLPYAVYSSVREQRIFNVPIVKPLLICVLGGRKTLGRGEPLDCPAGSFILLSNRTGIDMRNIPDDGEYFALLIEFEFEDFHCLPARAARARATPFVQGALVPALQKTLQQFVEWSAFAPRAMWGVRRQEILQLLHHLGHDRIASVVEPPSLSHKLHSIFSADPATELSAETLASRLAVSMSTLRRKLAAEGSSLQEIKDRARLSHGLHLVQTSQDPIGRVAERCGYQSQSRFTDKFKQQFGVTPTELRRTRLRDPGEKLAG